MFSLPNVRYSIAIFVKWRRVIGKNTVAELVEATIFFFNKKTFAPLNEGCKGSSVTTEVALWYLNYFLPLSFCPA